MSDNQNMGDSARAKDEEASGTGRGRGGRGRGGRGRGGDDRGRGGLGRGQEDRGRGRGGLGRGHDDRGRGGRGRRPETAYPVVSRSTSPASSPTREAEAIIFWQDQFEELRRKNAALKAELLEIRAPAKTAVTPKSSADKIFRPEPPALPRIFANLQLPDISYLRPHHSEEAAKQETKVSSPTRRLKQQMVVVQAPIRKECKVKAAVGQDQTARRSVAAPRRRQSEMTSKQPITTTRKQPGGSSGRGRAQRVPVSVLSPIKSPKWQPSQDVPLTSKVKKSPVAQKPTQRPRTEKKFPVPSRPTITTLRQRLRNVQEDTSSHTRKMSELQQKLEECSLGDRKMRTSRSLTKSSSKRPSAKARDATATGKLAATSSKDKAKKKAAAPTPEGKETVAKETSKLKRPKRRLVPKRPSPDLLRVSEKTTTALVPEAPPTTKKVSFKLFEDEEPTSPIGRCAVHDQVEQTAAVEAALEPPIGDGAPKQTKKYPNDYWGLATIYELTESDTEEEPEIRRVRPVDPTFNVDRTNISTQVIRNTHIYWILTKILERKEAARRREEEEEEDEED